MKSHLAADSNRLLNEAAMLFQHGQWQQSCAICESLLSTGLREFNTLHLLGLNHFQLGSLHKARQFIDQAIQLQPQNAQAHNSLASVCFALEDWNGAIQGYLRSIEFQADNWDAHQNLIQVFLTTGDLGKAKNAISRAQQLFGDIVPLLRLKVHYHRKSNQAQKAIDVLDTLLEKQPGDLAAINDMGVFQSQLGNHHLAITQYEYVNRYKPSDVRLLVNLGYAYFKAGLLLKAQSAFTQTLGLLTGEVSPTTEKSLHALGEQKQTLIAKIHFLLSHIALLKGDYKTGWQHYANRPSMLLGDRIPIPDLDTSLENKTVLVVQDQGIGDELFFLRFCKRLKERGAFVHYVSSQALAPLLAEHPDIDRLSLAPPSEAADFRISVADLPLALETYRVEDLPPPFPLKARPSDIKALANRFLQNAPLPLIGFSWRAGLKGPAINDGVQLLDKEFPLTLSAQLFKDFNGTLVLLQRNPEPDEIRYLRDTLSCQIIDLCEMNNKLENMLAVLAQLDDYIGVSNANMHLRGSLGLAAKVLIPFAPEWRWLAQGDKSPWYPHFEVFRQNNKGGWEAAIHTIQSTLGKMK